MVKVHFGIGIRIAFLFYAIYAVNRDTLHFSGGQ